jgi:hypothetical protein
MQSVEREEEMEVTIDHTRVQPGSGCFPDPQMRVLQDSSTSLPMALYAFGAHFLANVNKFIGSCRSELTKGVRKCACQSAAKKAIHNRNRPGWTG